MKSKFLLALLLIIAAPFVLQAQIESSPEYAGNQVKKNQDVNFIKTNITSILLKNYSLQYERTLKKKLSAAISFRVMPETQLPFKSTILSIIEDDDADTKDMVEKITLSNFAITPEIKFYLSKKGYGQGFYISLFYRYAQYTAGNVDVKYTRDDNSEGSIDLSGKLTANTGGFMLGVQKMLGKTVCLDIWILGPHAGGGKGNLTGIPDKSLSSSEQQDLREALEDLDIPLTNLKSTVTSNFASVDLSGPWAGVRSGISLGIRF